MKANSVSRTIRAPALGGSIRTRVIPTKWAMAAGSPSSEVLVTSAPPASKAHTTEVVVIGSGIGGLSAAAMLSKYGVKTTVLESHYIPGGAAHAFVTKEGYHFEVGPSLYSGMNPDASSTPKEANPLGLVLKAIGEPLDLIKYDTWNVIIPEGTFLTRVGAEDFENLLQKVPLGGAAAVQEWRAFREFMRPWSRASTMICPLNLRNDPGAAVTAVARNFLAIAQELPRVNGLVQPFSKLLDQAQVQNKFIRRWLDLLSFLLSGLPANGTIAAEMGFMLNEFYRPNAYLDFPRGGAMAMVDALARGVTKKGGKVLLSSHVEEILLDDAGRACGVRLRGGDVIHATKAVISNCAIWDTYKLLKPEQRAKLPAATAAALSTWEGEIREIPAMRSFMHLHVGFDATGLPPGLEIHHIVVDRWEDEHGDEALTHEQNVVLISIASVLDPSLAPAGKHVLHAYTPATEPYSYWEGLDRKSEAYKKLKEERSQVLWKAVEKVIPDIRTRAESVMVGTPLTHERFLRKHRGTYGPGIVAGEGMFPSNGTPVEGLYITGEGTFPGVGLPSSAASGAMLANTLVPVGDHLKMLEELGL